MINAIIIALTTIMYAYAGATMTLVGQAHNSGKEKLNCRQYPKSASVITMIIYSVVLVVTIMFPYKVCAIITNQYDILEKAIPVIVFALSIQIINIPCQIYKYALQAIELETWVLIASTVMATICCIMISVNIFILNLELTGVFVGFGMFYALQGGILYVKYHRSVSCLQ